MEMWVILTLVVCLCITITVCVKKHRSNTVLKGQVKTAEEFNQKANDRVHRLYALAKIGGPHGFRIIQSTSAAGRYELEQFGICSDDLSIAHLDEFFAYHEMMLKEGSFDLDIADVFMKRLEVRAEMKKIKD